jgi:hypothetical protein
MNPYFRCSDIMVIDDHINLMGDNPLIGMNDDRLGPRFPDMSQPYDQQLMATAQEVARRENIPLHKGVFVAVPGPNLETRAEYRFYDRHRRRRHVHVRSDRDSCGLRTGAIITDLCCRTQQPTSTKCRQCRRPPP